MRLIRILLLLAMGGWAFAPATGPARPARTLAETGGLAAGAPGMLPLIRAGVPRADLRLLSAETAAAFIGVFGMIGLVRHRRRGVSRARIHRP